MTKIDIDVVRPDASPWAYATVAVRLVDAGTGGAVEETVISGTQRVRCDTAGHAQIDLTPNADITPAGTFYAFAVEGSSPSTVRSIEVPAPVMDGPDEVPFSWADEAIQVLTDAPPVFIPAPSTGTAGQVVQVNATGDAYELGTAGGGAALSDATPQALGSAGPGVSTSASRADHVHAMPSASAVGAAPISRTVSAGTGLTGGGDLSANRTISADFGSTSGKVTEGNDSRLSDARTPNVAGSNDDFMQRKSGTWTYRTPAQVAADLTTLAPLASPTFTGTPAAPTATAGTSTTQVATTAFVASAASLLRTPAAVAATATNTTTITPVATFTVPGGELVAGDAVRMFAMLEYFNNSGGTVTCVLRGKFGSTTILTTTTFNMSSSANKAHPWVELDLFIESTTAQRLSGRFDLNLNSSTTWPRASTTDIGSGYGVATENTATDKDLVLSVEMGSAVSGVSIGAVLATAQIIKKR